jgi:hypothetical protein
MRKRDPSTQDDDRPVATPSGTETFLTDEQLAARWVVSPKTLRNARVAGRLLGFVRIGRCIRYRMSDVIAFEARNSVRSTSGDDE